MNSDDILDPVVDRTRQAREALARECGYDLDKMAELFKSMQAEHPERVRDPRSDARLRRCGVNRGDA